MKKIVVKEKEIGLVWSVSDEGRVSFLYCGRGEFDADALCAKPLTGEEEDILSPVEIASSETGFRVHRGAKKVGGGVSMALRYKDFTDEQTREGRLMRMYLESEEAEVVLQYLFVPCGKALPVLRVSTQVRMKKPCTLEYVSAFRFAGLFPPFNEEAYERICAYVPHNTWHGEGQWKRGTLAEFGLNGCHCGGAHLKRIHYGNTGTWSSKEYLPAGALEADGTCMYWQIEANGSWNTEIGQVMMKPYLALSGPSFAENFWQKHMKAGECFETPFVAIAFGKDMNDCTASLTAYRRTYASVYEGDLDCATQYNGYMHANWDNPTTERVEAQMNACAKLGVNTFVVDAGWFSQEVFWPILGDWLHPLEPFEGKNFRQLLDECHAKGMKAGLWLELEDIGVDCPIVPNVEHLLMKRGGVKVCDNRRYFFDFSLPETREYMDRVVDTVIERYGIDYVKLDYNCDAGMGCDNEHGNFGEGLLAHNRAFAEWIKAWHQRHPKFVIEGCASGGMRLDHLSLSTFALGNTSDQVCYDRTPYIACNLSAYLLPERMGVWAYPLASQTEKQIQINLVNGMLFRMQLSGEVEKLDEKQSACVAEGLRYFESLAEFKKRVVPYLPLGFCKFFDTTVAFGLRGEEKLLLAVYNLGGEKEKRIPLTGLGAISAKRTFPTASTAVCALCKDELCVRFEGEEEAAIFEITLGENR